MALVGVTLPPASTLMVALVMRTLVVFLLMVLAFVVLALVPVRGVPPVVRPAPPMAPGHERKYRSRIVSARECRNAGSCPNSSPNGSSSSAINSATTYFDARDRSPGVVA